MYQDRNAVKAKIYTIQNIRVAKETIAADSGQRSKWTRLCAWSVNKYEMKIRPIADV